MEGASMLHLWSNDYDDNGNALAGLLHTVLKEVGTGLGALAAYVIFWVAAALLLHQLAN
jgi:hypothetical protein